MGPEVMSVGSSIEQAAQVLSAADPFNDILARDTLTSDEYYRILAQALDDAGLLVTPEGGFTREDDMDMNEIRRSAADWVESTIDVQFTEEQKEMLLQVFYEAIDGSSVYCLRYAQNGYRRSTSSGSVNVLFSVARDMAENGYAAPIDIADYEGTVLYSGSDFY